MSDNCGCGCGHDHDHMHEEMEMETLTLTLDDDTELECGILGVFSVDGIEGKEYIALLPLEDETVLLYEYKEDEEGIELLNIESDEEYEIASGKNITKLAKLNGLSYENMADFFCDVKAKDEKALLLYKEWLGIINGFITLMNNSYLPDIFVFTGGVLKSKEIFWKDLQKSHSNILIKECKFGERAGLVGTGVHAFDSIKG